MLYGGAVIVLILCMGGLVARRRLPWAVGLAAAAAVWVVYASGWMNNMNVDDPGGYRLTGRLFGYHEMSIGAALALIGGIVACVASLPRRTAITPPAIGDTISRGTRLTIRVGLAAGLVGAAVYLAGTFLPYGGPSRAFSAPTVTYSLVQINVIGQFRRWPLVNQLAAGAALWTAPLVVLAACGAGLLARRDPAPWVAAFTAGALVWILRVAGETVVSYVNNPATFPQLGFQLMVVGFVLVLAGTVVALVALPFLRPAAVDSADGRAFNRAMDTTGRVATP
jgi:hypothetical protein